MNRDQLYKLYRFYLGQAYLYLDLAESCRSSRAATLINLSHKHSVLARGIADRLHLPRQQYLPPPENA